MPASTAVTSAMVTRVSAFQFGGPSGKKRTRVVATFTDAANGLAVGANVDDIPASVFGLQKIEECSSILAYTTSTGAPVRIYPASPDLAGTSILATNAGSATDSEAARAAKADITLATTESAMITVVGYP